MFTLIIICYLKLEKFINIYLLNWKKYASKLHYL